jgi:hypothetical protein
MNVGTCSLRTIGIEKPINIFSMVKNDTTLMEVGI